MLRVVPLILTPKVMKNSRPTDAFQVQRNALFQHPPANKIDPHKDSGRVADSMDA
jgi:hypothetical protein